jgi:hypothetical protein
LSIRTASIIRRAVQTCRDPAATMTTMAEEHTGGMIALIPRAEDCAQLIVPGGEKLDQLHLTLAYLGDDVSEMPPMMRNSVVAAAANAAASYPGIEARVMGHAVFNPDGHEGREPCTVYLVGDSNLIDYLRMDLLDSLAADIRALQHRPFLPHITARYGAAKKLDFTGPIAFDRLSVALGGETYDFPLGPGEKSLPECRVEIKRMHVTGLTPIRSVKDLREALAAGTLSGQDVAAKAGIRRHLIRSARALDAMNLLPEGWRDGKAAVRDLIELKVMSPDPNATKLREYWAHGKGRKKWHDWDSLHRHLKKYVKNPRVLDGLTANIYKLGTGQWPGRGRKDMPIISAEELKTALLLADPDADLEDVDLDTDEVDSDTEGDEEDEIYEQALVDEVDWELDAGGGLVSEDEDEQDTPEESQAPAGPRAAYALFD